MGSGTDLVDPTPEVLMLSTKDPNQASSILTCSFLPDQAEIQSRQPASLTSSKSTIGDWELD